MHLLQSTLLFALYYASSSTSDAFIGCRHSRSLHNSFSSGANAPLTQRKMLFIAAVPPPSSPPPQAPPAIEVSQPAKVLETLHKPNSIILDVRADQEIIDNGHIQTTVSKSGNNHQWLHSTCSPDGCPLLAVAAEDLLPDKAGATTYSSAF
jgi:hypothetical protein